MVREDPTTIFPVASTKKGSGSKGFKAIKGSVTDYNSLGVYGGPHVFWVSIAKGI